MEGLIKPGRDFEVDLKKKPNTWLSSVRKNLVEECKEFGGGMQRIWWRNASETSLYQQRTRLQDARGNDVDLSIYKGKVLLIVNVASQCRLTNPNYTELAKVYKYKEQGFIIPELEHVFTKCLARMVNLAKRKKMKL